MRHALILTGLAALAWSMPAISAEVVIELPGVTLNGDSARWGEWIADVERPAAVGRVNKVDSFTIKQKVVEDRASKDMVLKGSTIGQNAAAAPGVVPREESIENLYFKQDVKTAREVSSGQASGKRGHEPLVPTNGSIIIYLREPWAGCAAGDRFNGAYLVSGATHRYRLDELKVASCSGNQVAFTYARVQAE